MAQVGQEIRRVREERDLNQAQLAVLIGTGPAAISRIENGRQSPSMTTLEKIAEALDVELADLFPKEQSRLPFEDGERRADEFITQRPSDPERIKFIEDAVHILRHYYELCQRVHAKMGEDLEWHGSGYGWHGFYFNALQPAMERDGVLLHASFVVDGPTEVSERERAACENLRNYDIEMQYLVWDMRNIDEKNNASVREEAGRGMAQIEELLENTSKGAPAPRGPGEGGTKRERVRAHHDRTPTTTVGRIIRDDG